MNTQKIMWINRMTIFIIYFWFGLLKVLNLSPAENLVNDLFGTTLKNFISIEGFVCLFGFFECFLGLLWLFPKFTKLAFWLLVFHLFTTFLPIVYLPSQTWSNFLTPTLVGQYIIKNLIILSAAFSIYLLFNNKYESIKKYNFEA